jgi:Flp pilus assembly protein TadG
VTVAARWKKFCVRMTTDSRKGSAAIEFAFVAPIFFAILLGIFEVGIMFFAQSMLQNGTSDMARMIRTGQAQAAGTSQAAFRTALCDKISALIPCDSNLLVDVEAFPSYGGVNYASPFNNPQAANVQDRTLNTGLNNYSTGNACDVVLVRVFYTWPLFTPGLTSYLANVAGNKYLLSAAAAFRNEPFNNNAAGC